MRFFRRSYCSSIALLLLITTSSGTSEYLKWWRMPDAGDGRVDSQHHAPRCCIAEDCLAQDRGDRAFVISVRSPEYLPLFHELHCSISKHNPDTRVIVLSVAGDLNETAIREIQSLAEYREIEELSFRNDWFPRFSKNWVKLRAWNMTDLDAIIMLDADIVLQGDIRHLFSLPTDFAWATDAGPGAEDTHSGGLVFLRPCRALADDMLKVVLERPELRGPTQMAEQSFLAWYFRHAGLRLPSLYNTNFNIWLEHTGQVAAGGGRPLVLHFSERKLFEVCQTDPEWPYLCHRPKLLADRRASAEISPAQPIPGVRCKGNVTLPHRRRGPLPRSVAGPSRGSPKPPKPPRPPRKQNSRVDIKSLQVHTRKPQGELA